MKSSDKQKEWKRKNYQENKDKFKAKLKTLRQSMVEWFADYKSKVCCELCGFSHPAAIEFHHKNPKDKFKDVAVMVHSSFAKDKILEEMGKCAVLCANCHRITHWEQRQT
jgi:hypothetical protein